MCGADPRFFPLGSEDRVPPALPEEGVPHPIGSRASPSLEDVAGAIATLRARKPHRWPRSSSSRTRASSARGNARVDLSGLSGARRRGGGRDPRAPARHEIRVAEPDLRDVLREVPRARAASSKEMIVGDGLPQPERAAARHAARRRRSSLDARPAPRRPSRTELPRLPFSRASTEYAPADHARKPRRSAGGSRRKGPRPLRPRFRRRAFSESRGWDVYAIELNLPQGRTTHPLPDAPVPDRRPLRSRDARLSPRRPASRSSSSRATTSASPLYRAFATDDLFDLVVRRGLHFDQTRQTGVIFHDERPRRKRQRRPDGRRATPTPKPTSFYKRAVAALDEKPPPPWRPDPVSPV